MIERIRCACPRCTIRGIKGPAVLITLGVLFMLGQWRGEFFAFRYTWPVLLIVLGLIKLAESLASSEGHGTSDAQTPQGQGQ
ncbi:MAG: DUF5668 domain-containing protein [Acidobacteriia bacterium]|nr:DUF5668 domain-containing protein [Terriglobia bacterium]